MKGMILAAGIGSRLKPWTDSHPKALVPLGGIPMIQHVINSLVKAGIYDIIINVHHKAEQIIEYLESHPCDECNISISDETEELLDTGGAIVKASDLIGNEPVLVYNADIYCTLDLSLIKDAHIKSGADVTMLTSERSSTRQLIFNSNSLLKGWINYKENRTLPTPLVLDTTDEYKSYNGIQIINPTAIDALSVLHPAGSFPIIPAYIQLLNKIKISGFSPDAETYKWVDIGLREKLEKARIIFNDN